MGPVDAVRSTLHQYATFRGRARRSEFWWFTLAHLVVVGVPYVAGMVLLAAEAVVPGAVLLGVMLLVSLGLTVPSIAVTVRRLHDTGRSGWWYLIGLVPFGSIVLIVFACLDGDPGPNAHGAPPKPALTAAAA